MSKTREKTDSDKPKGWVLVLEDSDGALFTITAEILRSALVKDADHESQIRKWVSTSNGPQNLEEAIPGFKVIGSYLRQVDPRIRRDYVAPSVVQVDIKHHVNP